MQGAHEVTNEVVLGLTGAVRDHDAPASPLGHVAGLDGLSDRADLINLEQEGIAELLVNTGLDALGVGNEEIITDNLDTVTDLLGHLNIGGEVVLVEGILNGDDRVVLAETIVDVEQSIRGHDSVIGAGLLREIISVSISVVELGSSDIKTDLDLAGVTAVLDCLHDDLEAVVLVLDLGSTEATLITNVGSRLAELLLEKRSE